MLDSVHDKKKPLVFAYPVSDITMGRYLAAKGADFIGIDFSVNKKEESISLMNVLQAWIVGPAFIAVLEDTRIDYMPNEMHGFVLKEIGIDIPGKIFIWKPKANDEYKIPTDTAKYILCEELPIPLHPFLPLEKILLKHSMTKPLTVNPHLAGYWIDPGGEHETGVANFERLEKFFDTIEDI